MDKPTFFRSIWAEQRSQVQNNPDHRFELFILDPGEKKIETKEETSTFFPLPSSTHSLHPSYLPPFNSPPLFIIRSLHPTLYLDTY